MRTIKALALAIIASIAFSIGVYTEPQAVPANTTTGVVYLLSVSGNLPISINGIATTPTAGFTLQNTTAATSGVPVQDSPYLEYRGTAWNTSASRTVAFRNYVVPVSAATPTGIFKWDFSLNGGAATTPMSLTSAGCLILGTTAGCSNGGQAVLLEVNGYASINGLRINGADGANSIFQSGALGITSSGAAVSLTAGTTITFNTIDGSSGGIFTASANGKKACMPCTLTETITIAAAATTDTTIQMPANSQVFAVSVRVTTVIPTATSFSVGDSGSATRFSTANVSTAANSTDPGTKAGVYYNASALSVRLTMNGGTPADNSGRVEVTIYYISVTPPTS